MVWVAALVDVYVTEQLEVKVLALPSETSEHWFGLVKVPVPPALKLPAPVELQVTLPLGSDLEPAVWVSLTVAVQVVPWSTTTLIGEQLTEVELSRLLTVTVAPVVSALALCLSEPP